MYKKKIQHIEELQDSAVEEWKWLDQSVMDSAIRQ